MQGKSFLFHKTWSIAHFGEVKDVKLSWSGFTRAIYVVVMVSYCYCGGLETTEESFIWMFF